MPRWLIQIYTGPTCVHGFAHQCRQAKLRVEMEGTENIYIVVEGIDGDDAARNVSVALKREFGTDFGLFNTIGKVPSYRVLERLDP